MATLKVGAFMVGALGLVAALAVPTTVAAQSGSSVFVVTFDRSGTPGVDGAGNPTGAFKNPCTGEFVDVFGSSTITMSQVLDNRGNVKTDVKTATKGSGSGWVIDPVSLLQVFTGKSYAFNETQTFSIKVGVGEAFESDFFDKLAMKGTKSTDNWMLRARFRIKVSTTGEVQVSLVKITDGDVCKG